MAVFPVLGEIDASPSAGQHLSEGCAGILAGRSQLIDIALPAACTDGKDRGFILHVVLNRLLQPIEEVLENIPPPGQDR